MRKSSDRNCYNEKKHYIVKKIITILFVLALGLSSTLKAQGVTVSVQQKTSNLPIYTSAYIDNFANYFSIILTNTTGTTQEVYLTLDLSCVYSVNSEPFRLGTDDRGRNHRPKVVVPPGTKVIRTRQDYEDHFGGRVTTNITQSTLNEMLRLPEGNYNLCVEVHRWNQIVTDDNSTLIQRTCLPTFQICYTGSAPEFTMPLANLQPLPGYAGTGEPGVIPARNLNFRWSGVVTNCPNNIRFEYIFKIVKVLPGQNIYDAVNRNVAVYSANCGTRTYCSLDTLRDLNVRLQHGATYAVQVEAHQRGATLNQMQLGNDGKSQVRAFVWGEAPTGGNGGTGTNGTGGSGTGANGSTAGDVQETQSSSTSTTDNKTEILGQIIQHYIVYPAKDQATITSVTNKFSGEKSNVPSGNEPIVKSKTLDGIPILDEKKKKDFSLKWVPVHHDSVKIVNYEVKLYEYLSSPEITVNHSPVKSKTINGRYDYHYGMSNVDQIVLDDTSWVKALELGKKYYVTVDALVSYYYKETSIKTTNFLRDGQVINTEYDTTVSRRVEANHFVSSLTFQWGIDKALLDNLTPPQFTYPIDRSTADRTDTAFMQFDFTIPEVPHYSNFSFDWQRAGGADVSDTLKYDLHVWKVKKGRTIKQILKDTATFKECNITKLTYKEGSLLDSLKSGESYIARVRVNSYPDTNKYNKLDNGWSLPIPFKLIDTNAFTGIFDVTSACYPGDTAGLSRVLRKTKIDSLISNRVRIKMGKFDMIMQSGKYDDKKGYSGTGFVVWHPMGFAVNVKVHFDSVLINKDFRVVSGTAYSIPTDSNNYIKLNVGGSKFCAGFDMLSEKAVENMNMAAKELGIDGDDVEKWYNIINNSSNSISEMVHSGFEGDFGLGTVTTPFRVSDKMLGADAENVVLAINDMFFSPVTAQMNLISVFGNPRDKVYLPFLVTNLCTDPTHFASDTVSDVRLFSPRNYEFELADGYTMRFKMPSDFAQVKDGCYISFNKKGFKEINIDVDMDFGYKGQPGNKLLAVDLKNGGIVSPNKPVQAHFTTKFKKWGDWIAKISMDPFTIAGCEDWTFLATGNGIWYDHSSTETPKGIKFPDKYNKKGTEKAWQGFYMDRFSVLLPVDVCNTFVDLNGEKDDTPDSTVVYKYGANGEKTDSVAYVYNGTRIGLGAQHLILDENGISIEIVATDLLKAETRNGGGWYFSIDTMALCFEKNSYKYGKIQGKVDLPLFTGGLFYNCNIGSDSLVFAVTPQDTLKLDLFLAKINLDKKSSYFKINHDYGGHTFKQGWDGDMKYTMLNPEATTRVDVTLNGIIDINFAKIGIDASLPSIKFENMYMRNFRATKVNRGKSEVEAYKFGEMDFSIGNWSKASPQKYIGTSPVEQEEYSKVDALLPADNKPLFSGEVSGFKYSVNTLTPTFEEVRGKSKTYKVGIDFAGSMDIGIGESMTVGASAGFGINCEVNTKDWKVSNWNGTFDSARIKTDIGPLYVEAAILHTRDDKTYGNCWRGMAQVKVLDVVDCRMGCGFGTMKKPSGSGNYDWWYFEGAVDMGKASPMILGPVTITGFGGGFAYNCKPKENISGKSAKDLMKGTFMNNMVSTSGSNFIPTYDAWMAKCGISLAMSGDPTTLNADGTLNLRIANGHFSGICLQVNCRMMSSYDDKNKEGSGGIVTIGAFIDYTKFAKDDWAFTFSAMCKSDINMNAFLKNAVGSVLPANIKYPEFSMGDGNGCLSKYVEPVIKNSMDYDSVQVKTDKYNAGDIGGNIKIQIPIDLYIRKEPKKNVKWFFALGRPAYDDRIQFSASMDLVICKASTAWTFYFMTGNYFPEGFAMPDIPTDVANFLGDKYLSRAQGSRKLPTFKNAGGFAIGSSFYANIEFSLLLYLKATTYIGFDAAVINTNGEGCEGYSKIGKNGYYGMGQAYVMFQGEAGLALNLGFWKGHISLVDAGLGAIVQAGGPNPTWAFGMLKFRASCLGGLVKISTSVDFELGHTCVPGASDPLANVKLFQSVTPAFKFDDRAKPENIQTPLTTGTIVSNMPWNQDVLLSAMDDKANTVTRKFRFIMDKKMSIYRYWDKNKQKYVDGSLNVTSSSTDENTLYFEDRAGGFKEGVTSHFHLYARVFEYRKSNGNNLVDFYLQRDSIYNVCENYAYAYSCKPTSYSNGYYWRKPLYTDNGKTTFKYNKQYYQDTDFYIKTSTPPENLDNSVVFTWPYNGDPQVPYKELVNIGGRYYVLIYVFADRPFLNPDKLDEDGRQIMAFLIENGWGEEAEAQKCDYYYYKNGYKGSNMPCIAVKLPSDFSPQNYQNHNLAVRLMLVKKSNYQAQLNALNNQVSQLMTQTRAENQTRSNMKQLQDEYYKARQSSNKGTQVTQTGNSNGRGAGTGEGSTNTKFNLKLAQLKEATNAYSGVRDTAMNFSRKSLASGYVAAVRAGSSVYNLYFRLASGFETYDDVVKYVPLSYFFDLGDQTHDGSTVKTYKVRKRGRGSNDYDYAARHAYLFSEYEPNDSKLYKMGVRLPAIMQVTINYEEYSSVPELKLYSFYFEKLGLVNDAIKSTTAMTKRPRQNCSERYGTWNVYKRDIFCGGVKKENWNIYWTSDGERSRIRQAAQVGLTRETGNSNFGGITTRMENRSSGSLLTQWKPSEILIPSLSNNLHQGAPRVLRIDIVDQKCRIDSTILLGKEQRYVMADNKIVYYPELSYSCSFDIVDEATGTMFTDIKYYNEFFQTLVDYGVYMHGRGFSHKVDQLNHLMQPGYNLNKLEFGTFPLTFCKSVLATWWMNYFTAQFIANENDCGEIKRFYDRNKPFATKDAMVKAGGQQALYWQDFVLHINRAPYEVCKTKGTVYEDLFTVGNKYYEERDFKWFAVDNSTGIVSKRDILKLGKGVRKYPLDLYWFSPNVSSYSNSVGLMAEKTKETITNADAHVFVVTKKKLNVASFSFQLGEKFYKILDDCRGLKFRTVSNGKDWWD